MGHRPAFSAVGAVEGLGSVPRDVDPRRAVPRTRLACQAQIEGVEHLGRVPRQRPAARHVLEHPRPAAGHVLLVARGLVGGAHECAEVESARPAVAHARAAVDGPGHVSAVVGEPEASGVGDRLRARPSQTFVDAVGPHEHPRVEQAFGVEDPLDSLEQGDDVGPVHPLQQLRAGAPVAVLAREGPAEARGEVCRLPHEPAEGFGSLLGFEREVDAGVDASVPEMPVHEAVKPESLHEGLERAEVSAELLGRNGRILPAGPRLVSRRGPPAKACAVGPDLPQPGRLRACGPNVDGRGGGGVGQRPGP